MTPRLKRRLPFVVMAAVLVVGCHAHLTPVGNLANVAGQIVDTADRLLTLAEQQHGLHVVTDQQLAAVAVACDRIGREGQTLKAGIDAYTTAKTAGGDVSVQKAAITALVQDIAEAVGQIGRAIPSGTVQQIDTLVSNILDFVAQIRQGVQE